MAEKGTGDLTNSKGNQRKSPSATYSARRILVEAGRYDEAVMPATICCHDAARQMGDNEMEWGKLFQHQGQPRSRAANQLDRATRLYQQTLRMFQEAGDQGSMMRTYNLLGVAERKSGRLAEARAWYEKSRELAVQLKDQVGLGQAAQNIGIVCQQEGDAARERDDEPAARRHYEAARRSAEESLRIWQSSGNKVREAGALSQLAQIHLRLGDLAAAERHAHEARQIRESLGLLDAWSDYHTLSEIANARGDAAAASEWAQKRDALLEERKRRRKVAAACPSRLLKGVAGPHRHPVPQAGFGDGTLGPDEEEALAQLDQGPAPFPEFAALLRQLAAGQLPPIPHGLPAELRQWLVR